MRAVSVELGRGWEGATSSIVGTCPESAASNPLLRPALLAPARTRVTTRGQGASHALATVSAEIARHPGTPAEPSAASGNARNAQRSPPRTRGRGAGTVSPQAGTGSKTRRGGPDGGPDCYQTSQAVFPPTRRQLLKTMLRYRHSRGTA